MREGMSTSRGDLLALSLQLDDMWYFCGFLTMFPIKNVDAFEFLPRLQTGSDVL